MSINFKFTFMQTFVVVKSKDSKRYHIYNAGGMCVAVVETQLAVLSYLDKVLSSSPFTYYVYRHTCDSNTIIISMHS